MIQIQNNSGGTVIVTDRPLYARKKHWIKKWHAFGLFFAVSNGRIKKRDERHYTGGYRQYIDDRKAIFEEQGHRCPVCGKEADSYKDLEAHHALPWCRFPELRDKKENIVLLCHRCHKEIHINPWRNIQMMKAKADELGIDLKDRYDYGEEDTQHCEGQA